ncbi:reverse transcriptase domain-containing protein [Serratia marcescens]|uniref:reverse transcriptase domain-containing protein n=1 Tax=Serratia marcescens TaxID=615 RepID=UPI0020A40D69|nr:reverse transcriptase domain-containing protein [Serratia marcescens]
MWRSCDALVLKWLALQVKNRLPNHPLCEHGPGHRGGRSSLRRVQEALLGREFEFVFRTDIRGYYQHILKAQVVNQFNRDIDNPELQTLFNQYVYYSVEYGGEIHTPEQGIPRGCALSPIIGASLLFHVDSYFSAQENVFYARYMDDFLILTPTRWKLRKAVRRLNEFFDLGGFEQHPDKTQLGRLGQGFDWLGIQFYHTGASGIAPRAIKNHQERRMRLYEQSRAQGKTESESCARVQAYVRRWCLWADNLLRDVTTPPDEKYNL